MMHGTASRNALSDIGGYRARLNDAKKQDLPFLSRKLLCDTYALAFKRDSAMA